MDQVAQHHLANSQAEYGNGMGKNGSDRQEGGISMKMNFGRDAQ